MNDWETWRERVRDIHASRTTWWWWLLLFKFFLHQRKMIVFHWSLSVSKSTQVYRTLLRILADFSTAVVWMISILPMISNFPFHSSSLWGPFGAPQLWLVLTWTLHSSAFQFSGNDQVFFYLIAFFYFHFVVYWVKLSSLFYSLKSFPHQR